MTKQQEMSDLIRKRGVEKARLTRYQTYCTQNANVEILSYFELDERLIKLEESLFNYNEYAIQILLLAEDTDLQAIEADRDEFESKYFATKRDLQILRSKFKPEEETRSTTDSEAPLIPLQNAANRTYVTLPKLTLPTFSGEYTEWITFQDLFSSIIHQNERLGGAQKLQYLKLSLKGDAAKLLSNISVTDANYLDAWETLQGRYNNKRHIVTSQLKLLYAQPFLKEESAIALQKLLDTTSAIVRALKTLNQPVEHWDLMLTHIIVERMDPESRRLWELSQTSNLPTYEELTEFVTSRYKSLEAAGTTSKGRQPPPKSTHSHYTSTSTEVKCSICSAEHWANNCPKLKSLSPSERAQMVSKSRLCSNCLHPNHAVKECKSRYSCRNCYSRHHTLLCKEGQPGSKQTSHSQGPKISHLSTEESGVIGTPSPSSSTTQQVISHLSADTHKQVLLSTAIILIHDGFGNPHKCRALLDSGSQSSFINKALVESLSLPHKKSHQTIKGICNQTSGNSLGSVTCKLSSKNEDFTMDVNALVLNKITGQLPTTAFLPSKHWSHLHNLQLADAQYNEPGNIDVLLGADVFYDILLDGKLAGPHGTPVAHNTQFGWVIGGQITASPTKFAVHSHLTSLDNQLKRFWEIEEIPQKPLFSQEEAECEAHFARTYTRDETGRYVVALPFKKDPPPLGDSRVQAHNRLMAIERRLDRNPELRAHYNEFMQTYLDLGHMKIAPQTNKPASELYYMPHHVVIRSESATTPYRVVFDASAKSSTGFSLNQTTMVGPTVQSDLSDIILRFRLHPIALTADIEKMYRQISMRNEDRDFQRILWRFSTSNPVQEYILCTTTYGTGAAPYLATKSLQQLSFDEKGKYPLASAAALRDFYVDDILSGAKNKQAALELYSQLSKLCISGGFPLRKWASNDPSILAAIPPEDRATQLPLTFEESSIKTLGLQWHPSADIFTFKVNLDNDAPKCTKRNVLSEVAKLFDPLGWLAPVIIRAKILLQSLWLLELSWDDEVPSQIQAEWLSFRGELTHIREIQLPRCIVLAEDETTYKLVGFCDASEAAYGAVVYLTTTTPTTTTTHLVCSKTRVAPLKQISLPRLELCGALLLAKLMHRVKSALFIQINELQAWTDSTIVLSWLAKAPKCWKTFVANRITEIQDIIPPQCWFHVSSEENPANLASRGSSPIQLLSSTLWWNGPTWINTNVNRIPLQVDPKALAEERKPKALVLNTSQSDFTLVSDYSSLTKLERVTGYILRFIKNCQLSKSERLSGPLSAEELRNALRFWIKDMQNGHFAKEIYALKNMEPLSKKSSILSLAPFLDENGILRVGGRLAHSKLSSDRKHPILMAKDGNLTQLLIKEAHLAHLHAGPQLLLASLRQKYWIINGKRLVTHFVRKCTICFRQRATAMTQMMGNLPQERIEPSRPFNKCGLDYGGPFQIKATKGRGGKVTKAYICLFVCMSTKSIHLELASDLSTDTFLAALKRFISRRGHCSDIYSDNGTNFVGANNEMKELLQLFKNEQRNNAICDFLSPKGITWHFIPPSAPHFGGLWEAGIKSTKRHLIRIIGNTTLTFEEFNTLLTQVEACLNSRPICPISTDPNDLSVLTPGHFLIGDSLTSIPEPALVDIKVNRLSRWQLTQQMTQHFWKRWTQEYLSQLQQRYKWKQLTEEIKVGDLVLIKEESSPLNWKMARILYLHPGKDQKTRVVTIKTQTGELKRPISKICPLPIND